MPLIPPAKHSGLIVVSFWQNNHGHPTLADFETETRRAIAAAGNLSLQDARGENLPKVILQGEAPARRLASWVVMLQTPESANALAKRLKEGWIGEHQAGLIRGINVGNGHASRDNYAQVYNVRHATIYGMAFEELNRRASGVVGGAAHPQAETIADYLWEILVGPVG